MQLDPHRHDRRRRYPKGRAGGQGCGNKKAEKLPLRFSVSALRASFVYHRDYGHNRPPPESSPPLYTKLFTPCCGIHTSNLPIVSTAGTCTSIVHYLPISGMRLRSRYLSSIQAGGSRGPLTSTGVLIPSRFPTAQPRKTSIDTSNNTSLFYVIDLDHPTSSEYIV